MTTATVKDEAKELIDKLPENSSWDDLMHEIYVRQIIEKGLDNSKTGRVRHVDEVRKKFGLS